MKPFAVNPNISFTQLLEELGQVEDVKAVEGIVDQLLAKFQRKRRQLRDESREGIEAIAPLHRTQGRQVAD